RMHHHKANDPERKKWQDPEAILNEIGLRPGATFVDVGCGGGYFTLPAARMVGKNGRVYGIDSYAASIAEIRELADREGLRNLELVTGKAEDNILCTSCADIVFFGIVLHDFDDPAKVLRNAREMLKPEGRLVNMDWKKVDLPVGPPLWKKFSEEKAAELIEAAGFTIASIKDIPPYAYMITATP
ncbi:MAG: class I SAM-dependent methyltransferase, partial [Dehalococcoidales bacterium]|nr:class I SAM-dependent methyltransferase [Dehalococcoidales bacterium]